MFPFRPTQYQLPMSGVFFAGQRLRKSLETLYKTVLLDRHQRSISGTANLQFFCRKGRKIGSKFIDSAMIFLDPFFCAEIPDIKLINILSKR